MSSPILPTDDRLLLSDLAELIPGLTESVHASDTVVIRSVVCEDRNGRPVNHATQLRIVAEGNEGKEDKEREVNLGPVTLLSKTISLDTFTDSSDLFRQLAAWQSVCSSDFSLEFQEKARSMRYGSYNYWSRLPVWHIDISETNQETRGDRGPDGPFVDLSEDVASHEFDVLSAEWLQDERKTDRNKIDNDYAIIIEDPRVYLSSLSLSDRELEVGIDGRETTERELVVCVNAEDDESADEEVVEPVTDNYTNVSFGTQPRQLRAHIVEPPNYWFDRFHEGRHTASWRHPVLTPQRTERSEDVEEVGELLSSGEYERLEFKEWLPVNRGQAKSYELLKTACAFANSSGGNILVGVDDHANLVGTAQNLYKAFGDEYGDDIEAMRKEYTTQIETLLSEGIEPSLSWETEWLTASGQSVLRIGIEAGDASPYIVFETREVFVRRNATTRRPTREELQDLGKKSGALPEDWR